MPSSLPPLPEEISEHSSSPGGSGSQSPSAFSGGLPPMMQALQQVETGLKQLATTSPTLLPMCAQMISTLRMAVPSALGAGAGASPSGGPGGPAITGMGQNPTSLPAPPQSQGQ